MTERFTFGGTDEEPLVKDNITGKEYPTEENSLMELLNELNDKNDILKQQLKTKCIVNKQYEELQKIKKEHRKLQLDFNDCCAIINNLKESKLDIEDENEQLKNENQRLSEQKHIYKQDWKHLCIDKELLDSENEKLKEDNAILKHALSRIICEFDEHIAKNSEVRDLIK